MKKFIFFLIIVTGIILGLGYRIEANAGTSPSKSTRADVANSKSKPIAKGSSAKAKAEPEKSKSPWGTDLSIPKGTLIEILKYEVATDTFVIQSVAFPGEGESWVVPEALARAWKHEALEQMKKSPESLVGQQFQLNAELPTLFPHEIKARTR